MKCPGITPAKPENTSLSVHSIAQNRYFRQILLLFPGKITTKNISFLPAVIVYNIDRKILRRRYNMLEAGIKGEQKTEVVYENTATAVGSGVLEVFATPCMLALMEKTACDSVIPYLEEGWGTVGTQVNISHVAATPIGMTVRCESELTLVDGRRLEFTVKAYDDAGLIGEGTHERFMVNNEKFQNKANGKLVK